MWYMVWRVSNEQLHPNHASSLNLAALLLNAGYGLPHILQTHLFYDGLAQDVPVWSSQYAVIGMLVIMVYSTVTRRGFFLGKFG
jgi:hypothetical protein